MFLSPRKQSGTESVHFSYNTVVVECFFFHFCLNNKQQSIAFYFLSIILCCHLIIYLTFCFAESKAVKMNDIQAAEP